MIEIIGLKYNKYIYNMQLDLTIKNNGELKSNAVLKLIKNKISDLGVQKSFSYIEQKNLDGIEFHFFGFTKGKKINTSLNVFKIETVLYEDIIVICTNGGNKFTDLVSIDKEIFNDFIQKYRISCESESESDSEYDNSNDEENIDDDDDDLDNILLDENNEEINLNKLLSKKTVKKKRVLQQNIFSADYENIIDIIENEKEIISDIGTELEEEDYEY